MTYLKLSIGWLLVLVCTIPILDFSNPALNNGEISLSRDGTYYMKLTNKGLVSLANHTNLFETADGKQFKGTFQMNFIQVWTPTDHRREEGKRFIARVEITTGTLPVVTLVKSTE